MAPKNKKEQDKAGVLRAKDDLLDDVSEPTDTFQRIDSSVLKKDLEDVISAIGNEQAPDVERCEKALSQLQTLGTQAAEKAFFDAKLAVIEVKKTGSDIAFLRDYLKLAKDALDSGKYAEAYKQSILAKKEAEKQEAVYAETFEAMSVAAGLIGEAKKFNVDATKAIEKLLAGRVAFEKCDYAAAMQYAVECRDEAKKIMSRFTSAKKIITVTEQVALADKFGYDASKAKETLERAVALIKSGDYVTAMDVANLAESEADKILTDNIGASIATTASLVDAAGKSSFASERATKYISDARDALVGKSYEQAVEYTNFARDVLDKVAGAAENIMSAFSEKSKTLEMQIEDAEKLQINIPEAKKIYTSATEAFKTKNYQQATTLLDLASKKLISEILENYKFGQKA